MSKNFKKMTVFFILSLMLAVSMSGCGQKENSQGQETVAVSESSDKPSAKETASGGKVVMVTNGPQYQAVIDKFKKDYPDITLVWDQQSGSNYADVYKTRLVAGADGIDVFTPGRADYPVLAQSDQLFEITGEEYLNNFTDGVIDSAKVNDKVYGIPMTAQSYVVWYNKDIFTKYGLSEPTTMSEMDKVCEVLKSNNEIPFVTYGKSDQLHVFIGLLYNDLLSNNTEWLNKLTTGEAKWTDEASIKAIKKFEEWVDKGYILDGSLSLDDTQAYQAFSQGKAAMIPNGAWSIDKFAEAEPPFEVGAFAYVSNEGTANKAPYVNGTIMTVAAQSKNAKSASTFLNWISQPENAQLWCNEAKQFGTVKGVTSDFHPTAKLVAPIYALPKTPMFHAFLSPNAKKVVYIEFQKLIEKAETGATAESVAAAIQLEQDKDVVK
ncbi:ABC transporter substrate-binding protein [Cellulosilyticum sp. I15G10I2]|uniref:ABC transporter substrate-binding protein n=1 Tax=Cellulosilyticum sp. I15G10I2 TaxID=1892843 RepID=UPI00085BE25F|nr:extracellular solute-binding protein [Cellulosilyticum sp. I15G10I2]